MKFSDGLNDKIFDFDEEYGNLTYLCLRNTRMEEDENGDMTKVRKRVYDLLSDVKRAVVQVSVPAETAERDIPRGTKVRLVGGVMNVMARSGYPENEVVCYITANDIIPIASVPKSNPQVEKKQ